MIQPDAEEPLSFFAIGASLAAPLPVVLVKELVKSIELKQRLSCG